ncbi:polysaccharide lyase family 7 protein [Kribbella flavida]|uniref:polysaccharide lyase family 7 protein n=1 Tax=Kribbella flavida TaxID=182640 RepID=UPI00019BDE39|nr:polysaccharide lyase family 7 protein [Kribbella flavida]
MIVAAGLAVGLTAVTGSVVSAAGRLPVAVATASAHDGNVPANTRDNDLSTRWSGQGDGAWIRYDLGSLRTVGSLSIAWYRGANRKQTFDIESSRDGATWTPALARKVSSGTTVQPERHDFADRSARYLRIVGHGNTENDWNSVTEIFVNGPDGGGGGGNGGGGGGGNGGGGGSCKSPADVLNLRNWYIGLPIGENESPKNVEQPQLATFSVDPWFVATAKCDAVRFRAAVNGVTTSGSNYPRSELREMSGAAKAGWSSTSGTHTMVIDQAITAVPQGRPYVVAGQIHDGSDDVTVFRLEGNRLYVTDGDTPRHKLVTDNYVLGTRFQAKFVVSGGEIKAYYNGMLQTTLTKNFSGGYFKAGAYTQANCGNASPCADSNFGQVEIYGLTVTHNGTS